MKLSNLEQRLYDAIADFEIVDAHEHLPTEKEYLSCDYCGPNFFAGGYIWHDLGSAGMSLKFKETMRDGGYRPVEEWWPQIAPYWQHVKDGSYARPARTTARELYGIEDINDKTIHKLAECIRADNKPGLFRRILSDKCNIRVALTCQPDITPHDDPPIRTVAILRYYGDWTWDALHEVCGVEPGTLKTFEDAIEAYDRRLDRYKDAGAVGFKVLANDRMQPTDAEARATFKGIKDSGSTDNPAPLRDYLFWKLLERAAELDLPVAVHAGLWGDFRTLAPTWVIPYATRCPETRFDLFHLGIPNAREAVVIVKNFPNVSLNLCWCYVISQSMTLRMIDEIIDLVPLNKIIAFGGDYRCAVQKVYGHLVMARETVARALARRIEQRDLSEDRAVEIARMWFHDNPARIYKV